MRASTVGLVLCLSGAALGCGDGGGAADAGTDAPGSVDAHVVLDTEPMPTLDAGSDAGGDAPMTPIYATLHPDAPSNWGMLPAAMGMLGLEAGASQCRFLGADHPCDYEEIVEAASRGELSAIPMGTTAWLQRTTSVTVDGMERAAGPGANCQDWTFTGNHIADGEYVTFDAAGVPTYHFDPDPTFDPAQPGVFVTPGDVDCGGVMRALLCCNAR